MFNPLRSSLAWCLLILFAVWAVAAAAAQTTKAKPDKKLPDAKLDVEQTKFMRLKLEASKEILEWLTTENAVLIKKGARQLVEMSTADRWQIHHDVMYRQFSGEFSRSAKNLLDAAEKENFDGAALAWNSTTMKCLECHKFVRGIRLAGDRR